MLARVSMFHVDIRILMLVGLFGWMSPILATHVEETVEGELEVVQADFFDQGRSERDFWIRDLISENRTRIQLLGASVAKLKSGDRVRVKGHRSHAAKNTIETKQIEVLAAAGTGTTSGNTVQAAVSQDRKAVSIIVNFLDVKTSDSVTQSQIAGLMHTNTQSVDGVFRASSSQQMRFPADADGNGTADVFGPVTINYNASGSCDYNGWASAADTAATAAGVNLSLYQHRVYVLPHYSKLPNCGWAGLGNLGCGTYCRTWIALPTDGTVYAHELGHNVSMHHASTDLDNNGTIDAEYGDQTDLMGSTAWTQFNAPHRVQMGWYGAYPSQVLSVTASGSFDLYPLEIDPSTGVGAQVIKFPKLDTNETYYIAYRKPLGSYPGKSAYSNRLTIHRYSSGAVQTKLVRYLIAGETFSDATNGISVTATATGGDIASLQISISQTCNRVAPTVALSPTSRYVAPGGRAAYSVSITNRDTGFCDPSVFSLNAQAQFGFISSFNNAQLTIAAGATASTTWNVDAPLDSLEGSYKLISTIADSSANHGATSVAANAVVDSTAPTVPTGLSASLTRKNKVQLSWLAATDSGAGMGQYRIYRNGVNIAATPTTSYIDTNVTSGATYTYTVVALDAVNNASAASSSVAITVKSSTRK